MLRNGTDLIKKNTVTNAQIKFHLVIGRNGVLFVILKKIMIFFYERLGEFRSLFLLCSKHSITFFIVYRQTGYSRHSNVMRAWFPARHSQVDHAGYYKAFLESHNEQVSERAVRLQRPLLTTTFASGVECWPKVYNKLIQLVCRLLALSMTMCL